MECRDTEYWRIEHLKKGNWDILLTSSPCHRGATGTAPAWEPHGLRENAVLQGLARRSSVRFHLVCCPAIAIANGLAGNTKLDAVIKNVCSACSFLDSASHVRIY